MAEKIKKVNPKKDDLYQVLSNDLKTMKDDLVTEVKVSAAQVASMYKGVKDASASSASALAQEVRYGYKQNQNIYEGIATLVKAEVAAKISVIADKMEKLEVESVLKEIKDLRYGYMQLQAVYQALTDLVSEGVIEPVKVLEEKTAMLDSMQAPLQDISAKLAAGAGVSEEAVRKIVADSIGSVAGEIRELKYGSMQSQSMYHALSNLVSERVIAPLNTLISKNTEMDGVPASVRAINDKLAAGVGISEEMVKQIVEESLSAHSKEVLDAIAQATKESVVDINYEKIAGDTAAKVVESIAAPESINYEKIIGDTAGKVLENIAKPEAIDYDKIVGATAAKVVESIARPEAIDYDKIVGATAAKVVESMPTPETVDNSRLDQILTEVRELKYNNMQVQAVHESLSSLISNELVAPLSSISSQAAVGEAVPASLQEVNEKLTNGVDISEDSVKKIEETLSVHSREILDALITNPVVDAVDYDRITNELSDKALLLLQNFKKDSTTVDYDKIVGDTAAKVVESIPTPEAIDYSRIEEVVTELDELKYSYMQLQAIYQELTTLISDKVASPVDAIQTSLHELHEKVGASLSEETVKRIVDESVAPLAANVGASEEAVKKIVDESVAPLVANVGASEEAVKKIVDESVAPLAANVGASEEVVKKIVEDSLSAHCKSVFDSLATQPVIEAIDYDRIANQLNDKANELLEKSTPINYDKIVGDTAEKVVESLPYPTTIDYSRINEMIVAAVSSAVNVDTIADAVAAKLSIPAPTAEAFAVKDMPEVVAEEVSAATVEAVDVDAIAEAVVAKMAISKAEFVNEEAFAAKDVLKASTEEVSAYASTVEAMDVDAIADAVAAKIALPEIEPVDVDAIADAVIAKIALPEIEPVDVDAIADAVIAKMVLPETESVDVDAIAEAVAGKLPTSIKADFDVSTGADALSLRAGLLSQDAIDVNSIADAVSSKIAAPAAEPIDVDSIAEALAVKLSASASEPTDVAAIAEAVAVKLAVPASEPVDVDSIANAVASKIVIPTIEVESKELVVDYDKLADLVVEKLAQKGISADVILDKEGVDKIAETVAEKIGPVDNIDYDKVCLAAQAAQIIPDPVDYDRVAEIVEDKMNKSCDAIERVVVLNEEGVQKIVDGVADELRNMTLVCEYEEIVEEPAVEEVVEEATEELATEEVVEEATEELATEEVVEEPATEEVVEEPATEEVVEEATEEPATEEVEEATEAPAVVEFVVDEAVEEMAATVDSPAYEESLDGELIDAETGLVLRLKRSFVAKMKQSEDKVKAYYSDLKNELTSYKRINSNVSWHGDRFNFGRDTVAKIGINGKTLCFYLALDPNDPELKQTVYHQKDVGAQKAYESTPFMVKVKSDAALKKALRLAAILAEKLATEKDEKFEAVDYVVEFTYESTKALFEAGYIKATKEKKVDFNF